MDQERLEKLIDVVSSFKDAVKLLKFEINLLFDYPITF